MTKGELGEQESLKGQIGEAFDKAAKAQQALINDQKNQQTNYFSTLQERDRTFLENLKQAILSGQVADAEAALGQKGRDLGNIRTDRNAFDALRRAGINDDATLSKLQARKPELDQLRESLEGSDKLSANRSAVMSRLLQGGPDFGVPDSLRRGGAPVPRDAIDRARTYLDAQPELTPDQRTKALSQFRQDAFPAANKAYGAATPDDRPDAVRRSLNTSLRSALSQSLEQELSGRRAEENKLRQRLGQFGNIPGDALRSPDFARGLDKFGPGNPFSAFPDKLGRAERDFGSAEEHLRRLRPNETAPFPREFRPVPELPKRTTMDHDELVRTVASLEKSVPLLEVAPRPRTVGKARPGAPSPDGQGAPAEASAHDVGALQKIADENKATVERMERAVAAFNNAVAGFKQSTDSIPWEIELAGKLDHAHTVNGADAQQYVERALGDIDRRMEDIANGAISRRDPDANMRGPGSGIADYVHNAIDRRVPNSHRRLSGT